MESEHPLGINTDGGVFAVWHSHFPPFKMFMINECILLGCLPRFVVCPQRATVG